MPLDLEGGVSASMSSIPAAVLVGATSAVVICLRRLDLKNMQNMLRIRITPTIAPTIIPAIPPVLSAGLDEGGGGTGG
jgi:hypothetical protein